MGFREGVKGKLEGSRLDFMGPRVDLGLDFKGSSGLFEGSQWVFGRILWGAEGPQSGFKGSGGGCRV